MTKNRYQKMLNISENQVHIAKEKYGAFARVSIHKSHILFRRWLLLLLGLLCIILFLPWTQNVRSKGQVTTLTPEHRPQTIHATIAGRVERWYVREGQFVKKGDTIAYLSEIKSEYFDPNLLSRTKEQVVAKSQAVEAYGNKAGALDNQIKATVLELKYKKAQIENKIVQTKLKVEGDRNEWQAAIADYETEKKQFERTEAMFKQGIKSLTELENKRLKLQQTQAKKTVAENKYQQSVQEVDNLTVQLSGVESEYQGKLAKSESDRFSTLSDKFDAEATVSKLENQYSNYVVRSQYYYITAPQDCYITKVTTAGIGETLKEGEPIVSIMPAYMDLAVEIFVDPIDLPLMHIGAPVRFIFDGWPAFIFSGWPNASIGTYQGKISAMDNVANEKGKFRILVAPDTDFAPWPHALRPGGGAQSLALLQDVPLWYELWRQLNGFPPEYYVDFNTPKTEKNKEK